MSIEQTTRHNDIRLTISNPAKRGMLAGRRAVISLSDTPAIVTSVSRDGRRL